MFKAEGYCVYKSQETVMHALKCQLSSGRSILRLEMDACVYIYIYIHICMIYACIIQHIHIEGHAYIDIEHKMFSVDIRTLAQL